VRETPIAQSLRQITANNPPAIALKFVATFRAAMRKILDKPDEAKFQTIKLDAFTVRHIQKKKKKKKKNKVNNNYNN
jgi:hypothetical protein